MTLDEDGEDGVGEREFGQVLGGIVFNFVHLEVGCSKTERHRVVDHGVEEEEGGRDRRTHESF